MQDLGGLWKSAGLATDGTLRLTLQGPDQAAEVASGLPDLFALAVEKAHPDTGEWTRRRAEHLARLAPLQAALADARTVSGEPVFESELRTTTDRDGQTQSIDATLVRELHRAGRERLDSGRFSRSLDLPVGALRGIVFSMPEDAEPDLVREAAVAIAACLEEVQDLIDAQTIALGAEAASLEAATRTAWEAGLRASDDKTP